ncbi:MAG: metallophosphoesterase [Gemmataceae bacterium]|nr:metallophosphoesterase [Gemmataceae bacterium]
MRQAIWAFLNTPGRQGRFVALDSASEVMVAGDMHGNLENFKGLLDRAQLGTHPHRHLVMQEVIHGPHRYPLGGDKSHQILELVAALKVQHPKHVHMLLGNHEMAQWTGQAIIKASEKLNALFREGVDTAYGPRSGEVYAAFLELFAALPVALRTPNRIFLSHSLPSARNLDTFDPTLLKRLAVDGHEWKPGGTLHSLLWGRDTSLGNVEAFLRKVDADLLISGHIPCDNGFTVPNPRQLILDTMKTPACYCLFPTDRPLHHEELLDCVGIL